MSGNEETRLRGAYHEAGHAIALWQQELEISFVTINNPYSDDPQKKQWTQPKIESVPPNDPELEDKFCIYIYAGWDAEEIKLGDVPELVRYKHNDDVEELLTSSGRNFTEEEKENHMRKLGQQSYKLISNSWDQVELLANELLLREILDGEKIKEVLGNQEGRYLWNNGGH